MLLIIRKNYIASVRFPLILIYWDAVYNRLKSFILFLGKKLCGDKTVSWTG